ncbi:MAG: hypothetical protein K0S58_1874 [Nitrospira sp.]|nr:hypothetical protein [Nitrospira sp.]
MIRCLAGSRWRWRPNRLRPERRAQPSAPRLGWFPRSLRLRELSFCLRRPWWASQPIHFRRRASFCRNNP